MIRMRVAPTTLTVGLALSASALAMLLTGCTDTTPHMPITPGGNELPRCDVRDEIPVDQLDQPSLHNCNAEGITVRLPDDWGTTPVQAIGNSGAMTRSDRSGEVRIVNWGIEGVGVSFRDGDTRRIWGTTDAARQRQSAITP